MKRKIAVLVGSLRAGSYSKKVARALVDYLPEDYTAEWLEIGDLPLYNQDLDNAENLPESWGRLREKAQSCDAFLIVTPEYNRSMPAAIKNALDIGSRPPAKSVWDGKPAAVISVSPGQLGGFGSNNHLRQSLTCLGALAMQQPEAYISSIIGSLDAQQEAVTNERTLGFLKKIADAFAVWTERLLP